MRRGLFITALGGGLALLFGSLAEARASLSRLSPSPATLSPETCERPLRGVASSERPIQLACRHGRRVRFCNPPCWAPPPCPPAPVSLRFRLDKPFYQVVTTESDQMLTVMAMDIRQEQKQTLVLHWTPAGCDGAGNRIAKIRIVAVKMDIDIGGNKIPFDSTAKPKPGDRLAAFFQKVTETDLKVVFNQDMTIRKIEGADAFKDLAAGDRQIEALTHAYLTESSLKGLVESGSAGVPKSPVIPGQTWSRESSLDLGPIGKYSTLDRYRYEGCEDGLDRISATSLVKYLPPKPDRRDGLPFVIKKGNLRTTKSRGDIWFDRAVGRIVESKLETTLEGSLEIDIGGMATTVGLRQVQRTTVKTTERNPLEK